MGAAAMRWLHALPLIAVAGCQCLEPVEELPDASADAGDAGLPRCNASYDVVLEQRYSADNQPALPGDDGFAWYSRELLVDCVFYSARIGLYLGYVDTTGWSAGTTARICNACDEPVLVATTYHGELTHRENWLGHHDPKIQPEPELNYSGADLSLGLRDATGTTLPSSCVSSADVWCWGIHGAAPEGDAGSPALRVRSVELAPGQSLGLAGLELRGVNEVDAREGGDPIVPVVPFEDWRGYLFGTQPPATRIDLDGGLDLVAFLPRAVPKSEVHRLRPAKPRDQACAYYGFPLIGSHCRERLDAGSYTREDFVEVPIPNVQLPERLLEELKARAARPPDAG